MSGIYLADTTGTWNTFPEFKYTLNAYAVNLLGLTYTTSQWKTVMTDIKQKIAKVGQKSVNRDYA